MLLLLTKKEVDWLAEIRNHHMATRQAFRLCEQGKINERQLVLMLKNDFTETDRILNELAKRGL